jgi:hypothetical protein
MDEPAGGMLCDGSREVLRGLRAMLRARLARITAEVDQDEAAGRRTLVRFRRGMLSATRIDLAVIDRWDRLDREAGGKGVGA